MSAKFKKKPPFFLPFSIQNMVSTRVWIKGVLRTFGVELKDMMMDVRVRETQILPMDLATHVRGYFYNVDKFSILENALFQKIRGFDPYYGEYLEAHLKRTSGQLARALSAKGFNDGDVVKIQNAFMLHDVGKILQPGLWHLSTEKPSDVVKLERSQHVHLARQVVDDTIAELGLRFSDNDKKHLETIFHLAKTHHERLNGRGPLGWSGDDLDPVLRIATIIDEIDGKLKTSKNLTMRELFSAIREPKHNGQFDLNLIDDCERVLVPQPAPAIAPQACSLTPS